MYNEATIGELDRALVGDLGHKEALKVFAGQQQNQVTPGEEESLHKLKAAARSDSWSLWFHTIEVSMQVARPKPMILQVCGGQYGPLLTSLIALCVAAPGLTGNSLKGVLLDFILSCIVLTGIYAASPNLGSIVVGLGLALATLATHRADSVIHDEFAHGLHYLITLAVLAYAIRAILAAVVRDSVVSIETIKGAVSVYLLIGLLWVYVFVLIDMLFHNSFRIDPQPEVSIEGHLLVRRQLPELLYLSFCTLTTLGYGDIVPLRGPAKTACYLEAVVGQIFLTVLVARLVGMHISRATSEVGTSPRWSRADELGVEISAESQLDPDPQSLRLHLDEQERSVQKF